MPDLSIIYCQECESLSQNYKKVGKYDVCIEYGREWCSCPDFKFRKRKQGKVCKHIKQAQEEQCGWHSNYCESQTEEQKKNYICPRCGGPTRIVKVAI